MATAPTASPAVASKTFAFKEGDGLFSPKDLITLGRPGAAVANHGGDLALVSFSKYNLEQKKNTKSLFVVTLESDSKPLQIPLRKGGESFWLGDRTIGNVVEGENGSELYSLDLDLDSESVLRASGSPQLVGKFPTKTPANFRLLPQSSYLVFSDYVFEDGNLTSVAEGDKAWKERGNSALVYDTTYERHWDEWQGPKRPQLFSVSLTQGEDKKWALGDTFYHPLKGTGHFSPVEPFGGKDDFDVSTTHIAYTTKDPVLPEAWHTRQNVYLVDLKGKSAPRELTSGNQGAVHDVIFSTSGAKVAWLELDEDGYESDRAKIVIYDLEKDVRFTITQSWDRSPSEMTFSKDDSFLYLTAGDEARVKVFALPVPPTPSESTTHPRLDSKYTTPIALTHGKAASGIQILPNDRLLFTQSSLTSPNDAFIIGDLKRIEHAILGGDQSQLSNIQPTQLTNFTQDDLGPKYMAEGEEFWFKGANGKKVQGWALKPRGWAENQKKRWPGLLLIHGGPQGAWEDQWSNRWNPNIFANQGYFVIMINPTGSTTFGQEFTDAIAEDWGGKPFVDMIEGWKHALSAYPEIDADRAVAAGASWGGYAINWIQGHPEFGFNFKALVCHDGVFDSNYNAYSTDELYFFNHEWGGRPWEPKVKKLLEKFNAANYVHKWSTPQLIIHGSKDYRLPETEGIGAFHALQQRGVPSRLVIFPDENHWVLDHGNSLKWHYEVLRWMDLWVGDKD